MIVGNGQGASRQNTLAAAMKEWECFAAPSHAAQYLSDPQYRRKISRQLNKGESLHSLRRDLGCRWEGVRRGKVARRREPMEVCTTVNYQ